MRVLFLFLVVLVVSCRTENYSAIEEDSLYHDLQRLSKEEFRQSYKSLLQRMDVKRGKLLKRYNNPANSGTLELTKTYLYQTLTDSLFQFWYDTPWDFNGVTEVPGEGNIACGYFVTTTLQQAGYTIDRVYLAQQAASVIINTLCNPSEVKIFTNGKRDGLKKYLLARPNSLYILGLDSHVGFVQKKDTMIYMIHSSGFSPWKVVCESYENCAAIQHSQFFMIGDLLNNQESVLKWLKKERIEVRK
jgi:hypothetical protein